MIRFLYFFASVSDSTTVAAAGSDPTTIARGSSIDELSTLKKIAVESEVDETVRGKKRFVETGNLGKLSWTIP